MALGKKKLGVENSSSNMSRNVVGDGGLEFFKYERRFGKQRVLISGVKIRDYGRISEEISGISRKLESLPQDILVRIICGVEHEDLKQLFNVSKTIREATLIAKKWHFEYSTPKKTLFSRSGLDSMNDLGDEVEAALPRKYSLSRIICDKKVSKISMALFKSENLGLRIKVVPPSLLLERHKKIGHETRSHDQVSSRALIEDSA